MDIRISFSMSLRRKASVQSRSKTRFCEFVRVSIAQLYLDPTIFDGLVQPSLEIGISHFDEIIASKHAVHTNMMLHKNVQDLASDFFIRCHVVRPRGESTITQFDYHAKRWNGPQRDKIFVTTYRAPCGPRPTCGWGPTADPRRYGPWLRARRTRPRPRSPPGPVTRPPTGSSASSASCRS